MLIKMNFGQLISNKNKSMQNDVNLFIFNKFKAKEIIAVINYGSDVINGNKRKSDLDYIVIIKKKQSNKLEHHILKNRSLILNILTLNDLKMDAGGEYGYYFITKLINPFIFVYSKDKNVEKIIKRILGKFISIFALTHLPSRKYNLDEFVANFYLKYTEALPHYRIYLSSKFNKNKEIIWKILANNIVSSIRLYSSKKIMLGNDFILLKNEDNLKRELLKEEFSLSWYVNAIKLRNNNLNYPKAYIKDCMHWLDKNKEKYIKGLNFILLKSNGSPPKTKKS